MAETPADNTESDAQKEGIKITKDEDIVELVARQVMGGVHIRSPSGQPTRRI